MNASEVITALLAWPAVFSTGYFWLAENCRARWLGEAAAPAVADAGRAPVTFFCPLKTGLPDLSAKLVALARGLQPGDQLLIGAAAGSEELAVAEALRRAFPEADVAVMPCGRGAALNPKITKLLQMEPQARHEHWILSDSEALLDGDFLRAFRREWTQCDVLTAGYRVAGLVSWPQRLDAAAVLLTLWPGLAVLRMFGRVRLTLGACTGFRRSDLQAIGGWSAVADELAEDNRLGQALAAAGRTIRLSAQVVTLESDPLSWRDYWRHQRRVAVTYRLANPAGFAGAFLTQGVTTSLLLVLLRPAEIWTWGLCAAVLMSRVLTAHRAARKLAFPISRLALVVLPASVVETVCWVLSWGTRSVWWGGVRRRISRAGKLLPPNRS